MKDADMTELTRKFAVCDTIEWQESRLYWNVRIQGWVNLHNERTPPTLYDTYGEAMFVAGQLGKFVMAIYTDRTE